MILKGAERAFGVFQGVGLFEPRRGPGHWAGHSRGVSVPISGGVRLRVGQSRGHYVQGDEVPTIIDRGTVTISTQRVVFQGAKRNQEWAFAKLNGFQHDAERPQTSFQVSNRQKVSGLAYSRDKAESFRTRLALALAVFEGQTDAAIAELESALASLDTQLLPEEANGWPLALDAGAGDPVADGGSDSLQPDTKREYRANDPSSVSNVGAYVASPPEPRHTELPPAGWYSDPAQRFQHRWWDGSQWTDRVGDGEHERQDPGPL